MSKVTPPRRRPGNPGAKAGPSGRAKSAGGQAGSGSTANSGRAARHWAAARAREARYRWSAGRQTRTVSWFVVVVLAFTAWLGGFAEAGARASARAVVTGFVDAGFVLKHVDVRGHERVNLAEVREALLLQPGELIFNLDPEEARMRLEALEWVRQAAVLRLLPNRVVIVVQERAPAAVYESATGDRVVIDDAGEPIGNARADASLHGHLPRVRGAGAPTVAPDLAEALKARPQIAARALRFEWIGARRWDLITHSGVRVRLPDVPVGDALDRLLALQEREGVLDAPLELIDARGATVVLRTRPPEPRGRGI